MHFESIKLYRMAKKTVKTKGEDAETNLGNSLADSVYIDPLTDFGFKRLFYNKELLITFLNDVIGTDIKDVKYEPTEGLGWLQEERTAVFDKQAPRKRYWDYNLKAVYIVSILNFVVFKEEAAKDIVIERASYYREKYNVRLSDKSQMVFIELPKFNKTATELQGNTDTWLYLLKNTVGLKACPPEITGEVFKLFLEIAEKKQLTPNEMDRYAVSLERSYQLRGIVNFAREEAREENSKQIAIKLLMMNEPIDKIIYLTELSREQVNKLLNQLPKS